MDNLDRMDISLRPMSPCRASFTGCYRQHLLLEKKRRPTLNAMGRLGI